jgi:F-type H+-transporting ATPase subunit b
MNALVILVFVQNGGQLEKIAKTFGVDWTHLTAQIISFCIVCILLQRFAYRPILKMLEERRTQIAQGLANAEEIKRELSRAEAQRHEIIVQANTQAAKLIEDARMAAARLQKEEIQKAVAAAEQVVARAREAAERDYAQMLAELKHEIGRLVVQTAATVTGKILTVEDQRRLAEETVKHLAA